MEYILRTLWILIIFIEDILGEYFGKWTRTYLEFWEF